MGLAKGDIFSGRRGIEIYEYPLHFSFTDVRHVSFRSINIKNSFLSVLIISIAIATMQSIQIDNAFVLSEATVKSGPCSWPSKEREELRGEEMISRKRAAGHAAGKDSNDGERACPFPTHFNAKRAPLSHRAHYRARNRRPRWLSHVGVRARITDYTRPIHPGSALHVYCVSYGHGLR